MSMIYECPTCHTPQAAGRTSCLDCGAEFDGAVPEDALVPETPGRVVPEAEILEPVTAEAQVEPPVVETVTAPTMPEPERPRLEPEPPHLEFVTPPPSPPPPFVPPPYQPPPAYASPPGYPMNAPAPSLRAGFDWPKALLIAVPVVLVLVLGVVFFTRSLSDADAPPTPPAATATDTATPGPAPAPAGPPVSLAGGQASSQSGSDTAKWLVGRWQAKSSDYYVFNDNGTGSRGSVTGKQASGSFVWVMAQNQIALYLADKQEKLALSPGTDDNTLFLRGEDGKYVQYVRTKANA